MRSPTRSESEGECSTASGKRTENLSTLAAGCCNTSAAGRLEDRSRARTEAIAENLAMLRHVVINVLRLDKSVFGGISVKRKELTWDDDKLLKLMQAA